MTAKLPAFRQNLIANLLKQGLNFTEIAARVRVGRHVVSKYAKKLEVGKAIKGTPAATLTEDDIAWLRQMRVADAERRALGQLTLGLAGAMSTIQCPSCLTMVTVLRSQTAAGCRRCKTILDITKLRSDEPPISFDGGWPAALVALMVAQLVRPGAR